MALYFFIYESKKGKASCLVGNNKDTTENMRQQLIDKGKVVGSLTKSKRKYVKIDL